jgi:hypothetical protein
MSGPNDGHSMQLWPYGQAAGQDRRYFPLGASPAKAGLTDAIREENERFRHNLAKLLGSERTADAYIRNRRPQAIIGYWNAKRP